MSKSWWFWYVDRGYWQAMGPYQLTEYEAFIEEERARQRYIGATFYRWYYRNGWRYDNRNNVQFLASASDLR